MELDFPTVFQVALIVALTFAGLVAGLIVRRWAIPGLTRAVGATRSVVDDLLLSALRGPVVLWLTMLGTYLATEMVTLPGNAAVALRRLLLVLLIASITWSLSRGAFAAVSIRARVLNKPPAVNLISNLVRLLILTLGGLIVLQTLGVTITPLITALGIGGLAVGLALQDTLANLFAGIHILAARQVRRGDFVRIETGEEGYVEDITWRYTTVRQLPNNLTIVPNAKLASAIVTNYYLPQPELGVVVDVCVSFESDLEHVEQVTIDVAKEVMKRVLGAVSAFEPFIRYNRLAELGVIFSVIMRGREVTDQYLIRHEFIKRLHARYRAEDIDIPRLGTRDPSPGGARQAPARTALREAR